MLDRVMIRYLPAEDRLEVGIVTKAPIRGHRLLLTRRLTRTWLDQLAKVVEISAEVPAQVEPATRAAIAAVHHESMVTRARYGHGSGPEVEGDEALANATPTLVTAVRCGRNRQDGRWILRFAFGRGEALSLNLTAETMHGVAELLSRQLATTDWQLSFRFAASTRTRPSDAAIH